MSGTNSNSPPGANGGADPSMEDILASIRRILAEDEPVPEAPAAAAVAPNMAEPPAVQEEVLVLDSSMLAPTQPAAPPSPPPIVAPSPVETDAPAVILMPAGIPGTDALTSLPARADWPCFEDAVRAQLEPFIRQWLEATLPKLAERMVRTEVERVVGGVL